MRTSGLTDRLSDMTERYLEYKDYFISIAPETPEDIFRRFLFAQCTVNMAWMKSVELYQELAYAVWPKPESEVIDVFRQLHTGLETARGRQVAMFGNKIYENDNIRTLFTKQPNETWTMFRDRGVKAMPGLGYAKFSFSCELCWPEDSECVCLDRHMFNHVFKYSGAKSGVSKQMYIRLETAWNSACRRVGMAPAIARLACWDSLVGQTDAKFWACVFSPAIADLEVQVA